MRVGVAVGVMVGVGVLVVVAVEVGLRVAVGWIGVLELVAWLDSARFSPELRLEQADVKAKSTSISSR